MSKDAILLTTGQVAKLCHVHPGTVVNWRSWGVGPEYVRAGRSVRYKLSAVKAFRRSRRVPRGT